MADYTRMTGRKPTEEEYKELLSKKDYSFRIEDVTIYPNGKIHIEMPKDMENLVNQLLGF